MFKQCRSINRLSSDHATKTFTKSLRMDAKVLMNVKNSPPVSTNSLPHCKVLR